MSERMHGESDAAARRLAKLKGDTLHAPDAPKGMASEEAQNPWERPADRFLAAQAAEVAPRREAFDRLRLTDEHARHVGEVPAVAEAAVAHDADAAAKRLAAHAHTDVPLPDALDANEEGVKAPEFGESDERPEPSFDIPDYEDAVAAKRPRTRLDFDEEES